MKKGLTHLNRVLEIPRKVLDLMAQNNLQEKGLKTTFYLSHTIPGLFYRLQVSLVYIPLAELHFQLEPLSPLEH